MVSFSEISKPVQLWGTTLEAGKFFYKNRKELRIEGFIDNYGDYGKFLNNKVRRFLEIVDCRKYYYIFFGKLRIYETEIKPFLLRNGLEEFADFIYHDWLCKKMVLLHGNCHMGALSQALCSFDEFNCAYYIYPHKLICEYSVGDTIEPGAVKNCDVFIHQDIQIGNPFGYKLSDEYLVSLLKDDCKNIVVPNLNGHGGGFFPQCRSESIFNSHEKNPPMLNGRDKAGMFEHEDQFIDNVVSNRMELNDIMDMAEKDIFTKQEILQNFNKCMDRIKQREKSWDIKVTDFLLENYKKIQLFYDIGHPTGTVIFFYAKKLLHLLLDRPEEEFDRKPDDLKNPIYEMRAHENPVYPCVYDALGLQWRSSSIREGDDGRKLHEKMDLKEYVKEYIMWCYPDYWEELNQ